MHTTVVRRRRDDGLANLIAGVRQEGPKDGPPFRTVVVSRVAILGTTCHEAVRSCMYL